MKRECIPVIDLSEHLPIDYVRRYEFACQQIVDPVKGESPASAARTLRQNFRKAPKAIFVAGDYWFQLTDNRCLGLKAGRYETIPNP